MPVFSVHKSIQINAPIEKVHACVRDFRQWSRWSPWLVAEPDCKMTYADDGKSYTWDGKIVGSGELAIVAGNALKSIDYRLTFLKPWKSVNSCQFLFAAKEGGTEATWTMKGSLPIFLFWMKGMMEAFIGMDYVRGLSMLKDYLETGEVSSKLRFVGSQAVEGCRYLGVRSTCAISGIGPEMEKSFGRLGTIIEAKGVEVCGAPLAVYHRWKIGKGTAEFTTAVPVREVPSDLPEGLVAGAIPACRAYTIEHTGPYRHLGNAWAAGEMRARARPKIFVRNRKIDPFEFYLNDPDHVPANELVTLVHFPLR